MHKSDKFSPRLVRGTGAAIIFALSGMTMARAQDMKPYHDKKFGFQIACPEGWEVKADAKRILVRSQDHTSFAVIENFVPAGDETAEDHIQSLPRTEGDLLRRAVVKSAGAVPPGKNAPSGSGQAAGRIGYWGERGAGEAVVLCQVAPQGGLLFGIGATKDRLDQERPELIRILQSLRFDAPSPREKGGRGKEPVRVTAEPGGPQYEDTLSVRYIHWSDPQFKGFSTEVPQGWTVEGGTSRADVLDTRQSVQARSPHGEMAVMLGDNGLPGQFSILDGFAQSRGMHDGSTEKRGVVTTTYLHYMSPEEFNHWYLQNVLSRAIGGLEIGSYQEESDLARQVQGGVSGPVGVEAGATRFTWQDKKTGSHLSGLLSTIIRRFGSNGQGTWTPRPRVILWADGDGKAEAREKTVRAVFAHMTGSYQINAQFVANEKQRLDSFVNANGQASQAVVEEVKRDTARHVEMARQNAQASNERREHLTANFRQQQAAKDENRRKQVNYASNETDVQGAGGSWKVASGYSNYYRNSQTGTIVGTNSAYSPGVNFTPLTEH